MPRRAWWGTGNGYSTGRGTGNGYSTGRGTGIRVNVLEIEVNTGKCTRNRGKYG